VDLEVARDLLIDYLLLPDAWVLLNRSPHRLEELPGSMQREVEELPGTLLLAESATAGVAGIVFLSAFGNSRCEMKRLYVRPEARGNGFGWQLVEAAVTRADSDGHEEVLLDVLPSRTDVIRLYGKVGFRPVPPFRTHPVDMVSMSLKLSSPVRRPPLPPLPRRLR
jgi:ribosomal protein S18 acetylase RimI-like enzyme